MRAGTAPCAIITTTADFFFALASVVADELYGHPLALVAVTEAIFAQMHTGDHIRIDAAGSLHIVPQPG
jgi:predicted aconitase with swiveling domain